MTISEAFKFARTEPGNPVTAKWQMDWKYAETLILQAGYCPDCAAGSHQRQKLGPWQPGNRDTFAGRECPVCEQFFKCGEQPECAADAVEDGHSDADPGL